MDTGSSLGFPTCNYVDIDNLSSISDQDNFSILSYNIRSLAPKFDELTNFLDQFSHPPSIIALQEIWSIGRNFSISGYSNLEYISRDKNSTKLNPNCGGGVGLFVSNNIQFEVLHFNNSFIKGVFESQWVKIDLGKGEIINSW